jgi:pimeloyl-ACP methyl ester carboxylesterase
MTVATVNGVRLYHETRGEGASAIVLVHGSWSDHRTFDPVVGELSRAFRVVRYDRRGHGRSERPATQGSAREDAEDLAALVEALGIAPVHLVGHSFGGSVTLRAAVLRPELVASVAVHEPPLFGLVADRADVAPALAESARRIGAVVERLDAGDREGGARLFVETVALGPGAWEGLPPEMRDTFVSNAPTFADEVGDSEWNVLDLRALAALDRPLLLSRGTETPPTFAAVIDALAAAARRAKLLTIPGAGHAPQLTHASEWASALSSFARASRA